MATRWRQRRGRRGATNDNDDGRINKTALEGWRRDGDILPQDLATFATVCSFIVRCQSAQRGQLTLPTTTRAIAVAAGGKTGKSGDGIGEYIDKKRGYRRHIGDAILTPSVRLFVFRTQKDNIACLPVPLRHSIAVSVWRQTEHTKLTPPLKTPFIRRPFRLMFSYFVVL